MDFPGGTWLETVRYNTGWSWIDMKDVNPFMDLEPEPERVEVYNLWRTDCVEMYYLWRVE